MRRGDRPRFPVSEIFHYSNGASAHAIRCTGRTPRDRDRAACRIGEGKDACEAELVLALGGSQTSAEGLGFLITSMEGELAGHHSLQSESEIQATLVDGIGGASQSGAWRRDGDAHHHSVVAMEPDRHYQPKLALSCWSRQSAKLLRSEDHAVR